MVVSATAFTPEHAWPSPLTATPSGGPGGPDPWATRVWRHPSSPGPDSRGGRADEDDAWREQEGPPCPEPFGREGKDTPFPPWPTPARDSPRRARSPVQAAGPGRATSLFTGLAAQGQPGGPALVVGCPPEPERKGWPLFSTPVRRASEQEEGWAMAWSWTTAAKERLRAIVRACAR